MIHHSLQTIFIMGAVTYSELEYDRKFITYQYPKWAIMIGWTMALVSVVCIPIVFVYRLYCEEGTLLEVSIISCCRIPKNSPFNRSG